MRDVNSRVAGRVATAIFATVAVAGILASTAAAAQPQPTERPCGTMRVEAGQVRLAVPLRADAIKSGATILCLREIAKQLKAHANLRSVTVDVPAAGSRLSMDTMRDAAVAAATHLEAAGIPKALLSSVVPHAKNRGEVGLIKVRFVERRPFRAAGQIWAVSGKAWAGWELGGLKPIAPGQVVSEGMLIEVGHSSVVLLHTIDGGRARLLEQSLLRIDRASVTDEGDGATRDISLQLVRGGLEIRSSHLAGPFVILTPNAQAQPHGTRFRVKMPDEVTTRLETIEGSVNIGGLRGNTFVKGGEGTQVDHNGHPARPRSLLVPPTALRPALGDIRVGDIMRWAPSPEAVGYVLELARDAAFSKEYWSLILTTRETLVNEAMTPGKWFWRVTGIDRDGFEGLRSKTYAVTVMP